MKVITNIESSKGLGIDTGFSNKKTAGTDFTDVRKTDGYILDLDMSSQIERFKLPQITEVDGSIIVYSNEINYSLTQFYNDDFSVSDILDLVKIYKKLQKNSIDLPEFSTNLIYRLDNKFLIMPPSLIGYINNRESLKIRDNILSKYKSPEILKTEKSVVYSLGILLFQAATGEFPYVYSDIEDLRDKMRRGKFLKPHWKNSSLSRDMSNFIMEMMSLECSLSITDISEKLETFITDGYLKESDNNQALKRQYELEEKRLITGENRRRFLRKHSGLLIISAVALLVLGSIFGSIISSKLAPPSTSGFTSEEVLETYFQAFQTVTPEYLDDVLAKGVRPSESDEISAIYVTNKMKQQYNNPQFATPQEWLALSEEDKKIVDVYGINNLQIKDLGNNTFDVTYEKWFSEAIEKEGNVLEPDKGVFALIKREIFTLSETKYSYEITNIETISQDNRRIW